MNYNKLITLISNNSKGQWNSFYTYRWPVICRLYSSEKSLDNPQEQQQAYMTEAGMSPTDITSDQQQRQIKKLSEDLDVMTSEVKMLKEKNDDLLDKYRRALADSENLRVRLNKQVSDAKLYGIQGFSKDLLEVADTLGHAINAVPQTQVTDENFHLKSLYNGLVVTQAALMQIFKRHGIEPMNPINDKFDPNEHEALYQKEDSSVAPDTIIEVAKTGYKLHDRIIRPALVGVSK